MNDKQSHEQLAAVTPDIPEIVRKSNALITAKYNLSMLCSQLMVITGTRLQEDGNQMKGCVYASELRALLGADSDTNLYKKLKQAAAAMEGTRIFIDLGNNQFKSFVIVTNSYYEDGKFEVIYNKEMTPYLKDVMSGYTKFELSIILNFKNRHFYRLYELLKKEAYKIGPGENAFTTVSYGYHELRVLLGLVDTDQDYIQAAVNSKKYTWEQIAEDICKKEHQKLKDFRDFKKRILVPGQEVLQATTDIRFEYNLVSSGRSRKVQRITFMIYKNNPYQKNDALARDETAEEERSEFRQISMDQFDPEKDERYEALLSLLKEIGVDSIGFTYEYYRSLLKDAGNDDEKIRKQIEYSQSIENITNYYGWLREAVRKGYADNAPVPAYRGNTKGAKDYIELQKEVNSASTQTMVWDLIRKSDDFEAFLRDVGVEEHAIEKTFSIEELVNMYFKFKSGKHM